MSVSSYARSQLMDEISRQGKLGNKRSYSENSLQQFGEEYGVTPEKTNIDPRVLNESVSANSNEVRMEMARRRAISQPGPISGSMLTATAARAARKRTPRNVMYAEPAKLETTERQTPRYLSPFDADAPSPSFSERGNPLPYNGFRNYDARSIGSYRLYATNNEPRGLATPRKRSVMTMDGQSIRSVETQAPPPTAPEVKKKRTTDTMTLALSCMYAILLVTLGLIMFVADPFIPVNVAPIYNIILTSIGFIFILYLLIDIGRYKSIALKNQKLKSQHLESIDEFFANQESQTLSGNSTPQIQNLENRSSPSITATLPPPMMIPLNHNYCFSHGRHSGSFYLKLGAAGFALGHLVHSILLITVQIAYFMDEKISNDECVDVVQMALDFTFPLYCFVQLYFVFKYSNVIILKAQGLARFAFMHFIGSSLCFWLSAIVRETILSLSLYAQTIYSNEYTRSNNTDPPIYKNSFIDISNLYNEKCIGGSRAINSLFENFSPYLYPFSVEFNILIVAVFYIIWSNIGNCDRDSDKDSDGSASVSDDNTICKIPTAIEENDYSSNIVIHADCHASNRGLFAGLIVTVCTVGMLIIGFVFSSVDGEFLETGYILNYCTKLFLHLTLLIGSVVAYNQIRQLDVNEHHISLLDDVLLFVCLPAYFIETTFSLVATISILNVVKIIDFIIMVIQVVIQTSLICDALRRCSNSRKLRRKKPGREVIMFLLIVNVAMWIFHTFSYKSPGSLDERYAFYGKVLWTILGHISLPLMMFYRFHSSVCFADIWDSAFKPGSEH